MMGLTWAAAARAEPEITWYIFDLPPQYIISGPREGSGFLDLALRRHIIPGLSGYQHRIVLAPFQRRELMLKTEPAACVMGLFKTPEREQFMTFSAPFLAQFPPGVLIRRADNSRVTGYLDGNGKLSLAKLLEHGAMTAGVDSARSYGATVDELFRRYNGKPNLFGLTTPDASKSLIQMVMAGRIDVVLGFPYEAIYLGVGIGEASQGLRFYPLAEQPDYLVGHAACSKTEFGATVIRKIDAILTQPGVRDAIAGYYASWLDTEARKLEQRLRMQAFRSAAKP